MGKNLVIVESPTKVKSISKFLGPGYIVKASMGHVRDLPQRRIGIDVEHDFKPEYVIMPKSKSLVTALKKTIKDNDISVVYLAPDPDREGEAIAWHLAEILNKKGLKMRRVSFNEITESAVKDAFKKTSQIDRDKVDAQQARRLLDRIVGYKLSPLLWKKIRRGLSAGRVQSVAVKLICDRQKDIDNFKSEEYWTIEAVLNSREGPRSGERREFAAELDKIDDKKINIRTETEATAVTERLKTAEYAVKSVSKKDKKRNPLPPFTTSLLQQAAINKLGFTAQKTMFVAQQLYEGVELGSEGSVGLITYMRTDSFRVSKDAQDAARRYIEQQHGKEYVPETPPKYKSKKTAQGAHEAVRPSLLEKNPNSVKDFLTPDQLKLYSLIWNRFIASQMVPARLSVTTVLVSASNAIFKASGTEIVFPGFLSVYADNEENGAEKEKTILPNLKEGELLDLKTLIPGQHFTKPPPPYTEASLVKALEEQGIGRPSTYAPIINTIIKRSYVQKEQKKLLPTELGAHVNNLLVERFSDVIDVAFTAKMENELDEVEKGKMSWVDVLKDFYKPFIVDLESAHAELERMPLKPVETEYKCPKCGKNLLMRFGRFGQFLACSGFPECKHTESLKTDVKCPKEGCDGMLVQRKSGKGRMFYGCSKYPDCDFTVNSLKKFQGDIED